MVSVASLLEQALGDNVARLVLADWLEERGHERRAALLRRLMEQPQAPATCQRLREEMAGHPGGVGTELAPLLGEPPLLEMGPALLPFLVADLAETSGELPAGSQWRGNLWQADFSVPTHLVLRTRVGNRITGDMREDFTRLFSGLIQASGTFHFTGVAVGRVLAFVTHQVEGIGIWPGLYLLRVGGSGWLSGTWQVPSEPLSGVMSLRRVREG